MNTKTVASMILLLFSIILGFFLVEVLFRFYLFGTNNFSLEKINSVRPLGRSGLVISSKHSDLIYELKKDVDTLFKLKPFQTNSKGLRDKEYTYKRKANVKRVAIVGDSLTMGSGVSIEDTFHSLLEKKYASENNETEFINFGVGGYSLRQYASVLNNRVINYDPDHIIIGFYPGNDHQFNSQIVSPKKYTIKETRHSFYSSFVLSEIKKLISNIGFTQEKITDAQMSDMKRIFKNIGGFSSINSIPITVVYLTIRTDHDLSASIIREMVEKQGLSFIDVSIYFDQKNLRELAIYPTDFHPNDKANRVFADKLYESFNGMNR